MNYLERAGLDVNAEAVQRHIDALADVRKNGDCVMEYAVPEDERDGCTLDATERFSLHHYATTETVTALYALLDHTLTAVECDWLGIYKRMDGELVKLAYRGRPSRPIFPLTEDFRQRSNNVSVALTGEARIIHDVDQDDGPYYECDSDVRSEACFPIIDDGVIGIVDAEAFRQNYFTEKRLAAIAALCITTAPYLR